jgi:hypothetical protein
MSAAMQMEIDAIAAKKKKIATMLQSKDVLPQDQVEEMVEECGGQVLQVGYPFVFVMTFGWAEVAFYLRTIAPHRMLLAHGSFFVNAGKDYGRLAREGADASCQWRYEGPIVEINPLHVLKTLPYAGVVHRGEPLPNEANGG